MQDLKISLITVTRNAQDTIKRCLESVLAQNYNNVEYIIIDGDSTDDTVLIIEQYKQHIKTFVSEPDNGIYDAMNKGIKLATGDVIGILNADDFFADNEVLNAVANTFLKYDCDAVYGDLEYIKPNQIVIRKWYAGVYRHGMFNWGWMPPHPTFYCKKLWFDNLGLYNIDYGSAADYELMLRFLHANKLTARYVYKTMVKMNIGGISNKSYLNRLIAWKHDYRAMKNNKVLLPVVALIFKPLRKVFQYL